MRGSRSAEQDLAPHVDPRWAQALLVELRLRGVPGRRIGQVLAEVESHVVDSGEDAQVAFGDPTTYAASLDLASPGERAPVLTRLAHPVLHVVAMVVVPVAAAGTAAGGVTITVGGAVSVSLALAGMAVLVLDETRVLRVLLRRPVVSWFVLTAAFVAGALAAAGLRTALVAVPAVPALVVGVVLLVATTGHALRRARREGVDAVVSPLSDEVDGAHRRLVVTTALVHLAGPLLVTVLAALLVLTA